jgi:hypothetical protein
MYQQVVEHSTGQNGYEEYVMAAMLMSQSPLREITSEVNEDSPTVSILDRRRKWVANSQKVIQLVLQGNQKQVTDPRSHVRYDSLYPELSYLRTIVKLFVADADVKFADGNATAAVQSYSDALKLAKNLDCSSLLNLMVSCSSISLVLSGIDRHLQDLSLTQTRKLTEQVKGLLDDPASLTDASAVDVEMFCTAFDETPDAWKFMSFDPTTNTLADEMKALPQSEVKRLMKEVRSIAKDDRSRLAEILRQPEKDWFKSETPNQSSLANRFYQAVAAPPHSLVTFAQCRTQIRLLRLHCAIIEYRWEHNRLPDRLTDLTDTTAAEDPLTGGQFYYEKLKRGGYVLWSLGNGKTGKIELKYEFDPGTIIDSPVRP